MSEYTGGPMPTLGLVADPFAIGMTTGSAEAIERLARRADQNAVLAWVHSQADRTNAWPLWVVSATVPGSAVVDELPARLQEVDALCVRVGVDAGSGGRIGAALQALSVALADESFDETVTALLRHVADEEPDTALPSWEALGEAAWQATIDAVECDGVAALGAALDPERGDDPSSTAVDPAIAYLIEFVRAHHSRVLARALAARVLEGPDAVASELSNTKAPRKTLAALVWLARLRFSSVVFLIDGLERLAVADAAVRTRAALSYAELYLTVADAATFVLVAPASMRVSEVERVFSGGDSIEWPELHGHELDAQSLSRWLGAAALIGDTTERDFGALEDLIAACHGDATAFAEQASSLIRSAADRGAYGI